MIISRAEKDAKDPRDVRKYFLREERGGRFIDIANGSSYSWAGNTCGAWA
jgi:hypothetical protein